MDFTVPYTDFGARHYSPTLHRWLVPDPLSENYYDASPYSYCAGDPVNLVDPDGMIIRIWYYQGSDYTFFYYSGDEDDSSIPENDYVRSVIEAYKYNKNNWRAAGLDGDSPSTLLVENERFIVNVYSDVTTDSEYYRGNGGIPYIVWNPYQGTETDSGTILSPATILAHEADHAIDDLTNSSSHSMRQDVDDPYYENEEEKRVIMGSEQLSARANGDVRGGGITRRNHRGKTVYTIGVTSSIVDRTATQYYRKKYKR